MLAGQNLLGITSGIDKSFCPSQPPPPPHKMAARQTNPERNKTLYNPPLPPAPPTPRPSTSHSDNSSPRSRSPTTNSSALCSMPTPQLAARELRCSAARGSQKQEKCPPSLGETKRPVGRFLGKNTHLLVGWLLGKEQTCFVFKGKPFWGKENLVGWLPKETNPFMGMSQAGTLLKAKR